MSSSHTSNYSSRSAPQSMHSRQQSAHPSANAFVHDISFRLNRAEREERERAKKLVPRLAARAYHLEDGNTWCQDWVQYQRNTHPVFGLCLHHELHPIRGPQRIIILMGSIAFGLAITNIVFLGLLNSNNGTPEWINRVYNVTGEVAEVQYRYTQVQLEQSMLFLWTVGSFLHSAFDMLIWYLAACACFRPGGIAGRNSRFMQNFGLYLAVLVVVFMVFIATLVVVMRMNEDTEHWSQLLHFDDAPGSATVMDPETNLTEADLFVDGIDTVDDINSTITSFNSSRLDDANSTAISGILGDLFHTKEDTKYAFLVGYAVELTIALFIYYFLTSTVLFSGILGCGRIPILGGRPFEMRMIALHETIKGAGRGQSSDDSEGAGHV